MFDFLIPGYLGTEKQFHLKYARYIAPQSASFHRTLERALQHQQSNKSSSDNNSSIENDSSNSKGKTFLIEFSAM